MNSWTISHITHFCKAVLLQSFNRSETCSLVTYSWMFPCIQNFVVTENRNTRAFLWNKIFYLCFWQFVHFLSFHPNFFGPPSVIQMLKLHLEGLCRMPDRKYSVLHSQRWSRLLLRQEEEKKTPLWRIVFDYPCPCVFEDSPPHRNEDAVKANNNLFTNSGGSWESKKLFLLFCPEVKQCMITLWLVCVRSMLTRLKGHCCAPSIQTLPSYYHTDDFIIACDKYSQMNVLYLSSLL